MMLSDFEIKNLYANQLQEAKITKVFRTCDLFGISLDLQNGKKMRMHIQCFFRVFDSDGTLVICTQNLLNRSPNYRKKWFKKYDWTCEGATVFDDSVRDYKKKLFSAKISSFKFVGNDVKIEFDNGMSMDIFVSSTKYDDKDYCENYRIFDDNENNEHFIV